MHVFGLEQSEPDYATAERESWAPSALSAERGNAQRERRWTFKVQPDSEKVILAVARDPAAIGFVDIGRLAAEGEVGQAGEDPGDRHPPKRRRATGGASLGRFAAGSIIPWPARSRFTSRPAPARRPRISPSSSRPRTARRRLPSTTCFRPYTLMPASWPKFRHAPPQRSAEIELASADEPLPLLVDDPDSPPEQPQAKSEKRQAGPEAEASAAADAPVPPEPVSATPPLRGGDGSGEPISAAAFRSAVPVRHADDLDCLRRWRRGRSGPRRRLAERGETEEEAAVKDGVMRPSRRGRPDGLQQAEGNALAVTNKSRNNPIHLAWMVKEVRKLTTTTTKTRPHPACLDGESGCSASPRSRSSQLL